MNNNRNNPKTISKKYLLIFVIIIAAALGFAIVRGVVLRIGNNEQSSTQSSPRRRGGRGGAGGQRESQQFAVVTTDVVTGNISDFIRLTGDVAAKEEVEVFPEIAGKLLQIDVILGQNVARGQRLALVDASRPGQQFAPSPVRAQIAGIITKIYLDIGEVVATAQPIVQISDVRELLLRSSVVERYSSEIALGKRAEIRFEALPGSIQEGYVSEISPVIDTRTRTQDFALSFVNQDERLRPGMFGSIQLITEIKNDTIIIPSDSIVNRFDTNYVFVIENDIAIQREVEVGIEVEDVSEILSGLSGTEKIVYKGQTFLEDGTSVQVVNNVDLLSNE